MELFATKELSQLLQSRFILMVPAVLCGISLISLLSRTSPERMIQVNGFGVVSTKCASARLIMQLPVGV
jgi:hypothetical protein